MEQNIKHYFETGSNRSQCNIISFGDILVFKLPWKQKMQVVASDKIKINGSSFWKKRF